MTAPDLTDAARDEYRRLSAQVVEYLTGQGWTVQHYDNGIVLVSPGRLHIEWFGLWATSTLATWTEQEPVHTLFRAPTSSAQQAVDYLVVAAILPESMASWASRLDEVAR